MIAHNRPHSLFVIVFAIIISLLLLINFKIAFLVSALPFLGYLFLSNKLSALYLYILILPYNLSPYVAYDIMGVPGLKPFNLLCLIMVVLLFHFRSSQPAVDYEGSVVRKINIFFFLYLVIFAIGAARATGYIQMYYNYTLDPKFSSSLQYLLSFFVRPVLYTVPFFYVMSIAKREEDIDKITNIICVATLLLSIVVISLVAVNYQLLSSERLVMNEVFESALGLHYNTLGTIFLILVPLLLYKATREGVIAKLTFILAVVAVLLIRSRSAILVVCFSIILLFLLLGKKRQLLVFLPCVPIFLVLYPPEFLMKTMSVGSEKLTVDSISNSRLGGIWAPYFYEYLFDLKKTLFGVGLHGMIASPSFYRVENHIVKALQAHNAYFDLFLNFGVTVLGLFLFFSVKLLRHAYHLVRKYNNPFIFSLFVSILSYLLSAFSERTFYPSYDNMFLFIIISLFLKTIIMLEMRSI